METPVAEVSRVDADRQLADQAVIGDQVAFVALYQRHHREVYRIGQAVTGNDETAKDVVQETFLKVHKGLAAWRRASSLRTWIFRIAVRTAIDQRRRLSRYASFASSPPEEPCHDPRVAIEDAIALRRVQELAQLLPGQQGLILRLRLLGDLTNREIADALGLTPANVRMQTTKAIRRLREML